MRRIHLFLCLGALAAVSSAVLVVRAVHPHARGPALDTALEKVDERNGAYPSAALLEPPSVSSTDAAREAVPTALTEDRCASLAAELEVERAARIAAELENAKLREELARRSRELLALQFPEETPYGAFLASVEADEIAENIRGGKHLYEALLDGLRDDLEWYQAQAARDPSAHNANLVTVTSARLQQLSKDREVAVTRVFSNVKSWLEEFPVILRPGEATWIVERMVIGQDGYDGLVRFLGHKRLAAEIPLDKLFEDFLSDDDHGLALQAVLPPEKRAELKARLHALVANTSDPEELAWLRESFPSFFD